MSLELPAIYPITDTRISGLSHAEQARRFIGGGATHIQLREKYAMPGDWFDDAKAAAELCRKSGVRLIINDRVDIAMAIGADGVHLGQTDLAPRLARDLLGTDKIIGYSTHTLDQLASAIMEPVDYLAFGPVFATETKAEADPTVGIDLLKAAVKLAGNIPLVAIGGITPKNLARVAATGVASAAIISALLADPANIAACYSDLTRIVVNQS